MTTTSVAFSHGRAPAKHAHSGKFSYLRSHSPIAFVGVTIAEGRNGSISVTIRFRKPDRTFGTVEVGFRDLRFPKTMVRLLEARGCIMPLNDAKAQRITRRLRREALCALRDPKRQRRVTCGSALAAEICRWLNEEITVVAWDTKGERNNVVYHLGDPDAAVYLVPSTILRQHFRDRAKTTAALRIMKRDGGLTTETGRSVLTTQFWLDNPRRRKSFYAISVAYAKACLRKSKRPPSPWGALNPTGWPRSALSG
jgi:hypothetical protein